MFPRSFARFWEVKLLLVIAGIFTLSQIHSRYQSVALSSHMMNRLRALPLRTLAECYSLASLRSRPVRQAYVQYGTSYTHVNLALINFVYLRAAKTAIPDLVILYHRPLSDLVDTWLELSTIATKHDIQLVPIDSLGSGAGSASPWHGSLMKLHVFRQTQYDRIVYFDADSILLDLDQDLAPVHLDELFAIPSTVQYALPRAYWLDDGWAKQEEAANARTRKSEAELEKTSSKKLKDGNLHDRADIAPRSSSVQCTFTDLSTFSTCPVAIEKVLFATHIMVINPSMDAFNSLMGVVARWNRSRWWMKLKPSSPFDMDVINQWLAQELLSAESTIQAAVLPHHTYGALTGELSQPQHDAFLAVTPETEHANSGAKFSAAEYARLAKLIHFSDAPVPKPWDRDSNEAYYRALHPTCEEWKVDPDSPFTPQRVVDCDSARAWHAIRRESLRRRNAVAWVV